MQLRRLAGGCFDGTCPTLYETDRGTIVVQGHLVDHTDVRNGDVVLGDGEALVEIPAELLARAHV
jgi:hypothetical protein